MKILLLALPEEHKVRDYATPNLFNDRFMQYPPLGLLCLAPPLQPRHQVQVLDAAVKRLSIAETVRRVLVAAPDVLGISTMTRLLYPLAAVAAAVKRARPETIIVAGGVHATAYPAATLALPGIDYLIAGPGEESFPQLADWLAAGHPVSARDAIAGLYCRDQAGALRGTPPRLAAADLDRQPLPARELLDADDYFTAAARGRMTTVFSSRGCPARCIFCDIPDRRFQARSPRRLADEFAMVAAQGYDEIHVFDDAFNIDRERVVEFCRELIRRRSRIRWSARGRLAPFDREMAGLLRAAGCFRLHVGVESFDPALLKTLRKGITPDQIERFFRLSREFRFDTMAYFIIGVPGETAAYRRDLYERILALRPTYFVVNVLYPLPGTDYYRRLLADGTYAVDHWAEFIRHPVPDYLPPPPRSPAEHAELQAIAAAYPRRYYLSPRVVLRELWRDRAAPGRLWRKPRLGRQLLAAVPLGRG